MYVLYAHANVYSTCLNILREKGYSVAAQGGYDSEGEWDLDEVIWTAEKHGKVFAAHTPAELLGLAAIFEHKGEPHETEPYWWGVDGPIDWTKLLAQIPSYEEQQAAQEEFLRGFEGDGPADGA